MSGGVVGVVLDWSDGWPVGAGTDTVAPGTGTGGASGVGWLAGTPGSGVAGPFGTDPEVSGVDGTLDCGAPGVAAGSCSH